MAKYIKCHYCGKRINFGAVVHHDYCEVYCSGECYAYQKANIGHLDEQLANDCDCTIFDDEVRISEIRKEMEEHRIAMEKLYNELELLTAQN